MVNHYSVLGVSQKASQDDIKAAFKKLALKYHPDKNPGNKASEEYFKEINRAYQVLSDPYKRHQHDMVLNYQDRPVQPYRTSREPFYYPPFAKNKRRPYGGYQYGWKYVKTQLAAFSVVFFVALVVMAVQYTYSEYKKGEAIRLAEVRQQFFDEAQAHFDSGHYQQALDIIMMLYEKNRIEPSIRDYRDKFVSSIVSMGDSQFESGQFDSALLHFTLASDYQRIDDPRVFNKMAQCNMALGNYKAAIDDFGNLLSFDRENLKLNFQIGLIYLDNLNDPSGARPYLDLARVRVKKILVQTYGFAPELVMRPEDTPKLYYDVFFARARALTKLKDYDEAVKDCNWSVFLDPENAEAFYMRAENYFGLGKPFKACKNWNEAALLNHTEAIAKQQQYCR